MIYNYNLGIVLLECLSWTFLLKMFAGRLTKGISSSSHPFLIGAVSLFSIFVFFALGTYSLSTPLTLAYFFFFSALVVTMFTDATTLLISRTVTLYSMPIGWILAKTEILPISILESIIGSIFGLLLLWSVRTISRKIMGKDGLGQGDIDLLAFIGAFIGPIGCWITLITGSLIGSIIGIIYMIIGRKNGTGVLLPFGLFLAIGATLYVLFQENLISLFIPQF